MRTLVAISKVGNVESFVQRLRTRYDEKNITKQTMDIILRVKRDGDSAINFYEKKFGAATPKHIRITPQQIRDAQKRVTKKEFLAIKVIAKRLAFAETATKKILRPTTLRIGGMRLSREFIPLSSVGCYVPGGTARYPSSAIMSIVPARIAGIKRIVVASPPNSEGQIDPLTLTAANMCGATEIYCMGGAQGIAALAYGTPTVKPVDKIVGPGGAYVVAAKSLVSDKVGIDMTAGPTELGIIADSSASSLYIALDMVSQSEHSIHASCFLATNSVKLAQDVAKKLEELCITSARSKIVRASLSKNAFIAVCKSSHDAIRLVELVSPEHVQVMTKNPARDAKLVRSAGLVLLGSTPSAASDYALGSNHILPTRRNGRLRGPLSVLDFLKLRATVQTTRDELYRIMPHIDALASAEGLIGHADAVRGRL